jgi:hypothetical protein
MIYQNEQWCLSRGRLLVPQAWVSRWLIMRWSLDPGSDEVAVFGDLYECARWRAGVRLGELLDILQPDRRIINEALAEILRDAATVDETGH